MIKLGQRFEPTFAGTPPGVSPNDRDLWHRWRVMFAHEYESFHFNVRVAGRTDLRPETPPLEAEQIFDNTSFRIDAVGERADSWDIIEMRIHAGLGALGSILAYEQLFITNMGTLRPTRKILVTDNLRSALYPVFKRFNIRVDVV